MTQRSPAVFSASGLAFPDGSKGVCTSVCLPHRGHITSRPVCGWWSSATGGLTAAALSSALAKGMGCVVPVREAPIQLCSLTC